MEERESELLVKRSLDALGLVADCHPEAPVPPTPAGISFTSSLNSDLMSVVLLIAASPWF